jgi:hypothetical protein
MLVLVLRVPGWRFYRSNPVCIERLTFTHHPRRAGSVVQLPRVLGWELPRTSITAWFSFSIASSSHVRKVTPVFAFEFSKNILWVCCLDIVALWAWNLGIHPNDAIANRLVNVLSVYLLLIVLVKRVGELAPECFSELVNLSWMVFAWLPFGSGYALVSQAHLRALRTSHYATAELGPVALFNLFNQPGSLDLH